MHCIFDERNVNGGVILAPMREIIDEVQQNIRASIRQDIAAEIQWYGFGEGTEAAVGEQATPNSRRDGHAPSSYQLH